MYFAYVIYSVDFDRYYVGISLDVEYRLTEHNKGKTKSTKAFRPWKIIHIEEYESRQLARTREVYLKSAAGRKWRKDNLGM
ncbi:GIY-YIG nuclease family protein [Flavobacteriaceae bacterium LMO-SS05]|jgi:putative endonuclease